MCSLFIGDELWAWDGETTSQFGDPIAHQRDLGNTSPTKNGDQAGVSALSVVDLGGAQLGNALRHTTTSMVGGVIHPISDLTLPSRYVVVAQFTGESGTINPAVYLAFGVDGSDQAQGFFTQRAYGASALIRALIDDTCNFSESFASGGNYEAGSSMPRGGVTQILTVYKDDVEQTRVQTMELYWNNGDLHTDACLPSTITGASAAWAAAATPFTQIGIGGWHGNLAAASGQHDITDLRIYAHPLD